MRYFVNIDLKKFNNAFVANIQGKTTAKKCVCIPIEDNELFVGEKTISASAVAYESDKFGHSHSIRMCVSAEKLATMTEEEKKQIPYIGHMKIYETNIQSVEVAADQVTTENDDDLPF